MSSELDLIESVLTHHFGRYVACVAKQIYLLGPLEFCELIKVCEVNVTEDVVGDTLVLLLQHNVVSVTRQENIFKYTLLVNEVFARLRYANFLKLVETNKGVTARNILFCILKLGRANYKTIANEIANDNYLSNDHNITNDDIVKDLNDLLMENIVMRVSPVEFKDHASKLTVEHEVNAQKSTSRQTKKQVRGRKSTCEVTQMNEKVTGMQVSLDGVFRTNTQVLSLELLKQMVEKMQISRFPRHEITKDVIRILLKGIKISGNTVVAGSFTFDEIAKELYENEEQIDKQQLILLLEIMPRHADKIVMMQKKGQMDSYCIDWQRSMSILRHKASYNVVEMRMGKEGARIWNLMIHTSTQSKPYLLDQEIADKMLLTIDKTRSTLYKLCDNGYIRRKLEDRYIGSGAADVGIKREWIFDTSEEFSYQKTLKDICEVIMKMMIRKNIENERISKLYLRNEVNISGDNSRRSKDMEKAEDIIEYELIKLDHYLLLPLQTDVVIL